MVGGSTRDPLCTVGGNVNQQPLWETVGRVLRRLEIELLYDPAAPLLGVPKGNEVRVSRHVCSHTVPVALFRSAKTWE